MMDALIRFKHVVKKYGEQTVLKDFSLDIPKGEFLTVIGRSGCGKTTALKMINGLNVPDEGNIYVEGKDISGVDQISLRRKIGYVIQSIGLFPHMTVEKNITYVPDLSGQWDRPTAKRKVGELLEKVGLDMSYAKRYPDELSGGQCQRVGIARALASNPEILLMDEPFGAVDEITRKTLQGEILHIQKKLNVTVIFITHDIKEALRLGTRVLVMDEGGIAQLDTPEHIRRYPKNQFVRELVTSV